ncbi:Rne/Rng family ribonuclease [Micromonospora sp. NPDC003197]
MLENEPEGGERTGSQPAADTAENADATPARRTRATRRRTSPTASEPAPTGAPVEAPTVARTTSGEAPEAEVIAPVAGDTTAAPKTTRRRRKATTADRKEEGGASSQTGATSAEAASPTETESAATTGATEAGPSDTPAGSSEAAAGSPEAPTGSSGASAGPSAEATGAAEAAAGSAETGVAPTKATRTRRKKAVKAVPPPVETPGGADIPATAEPAAPGGAVEISGQPSVTTPAETAPARVVPAGGEPAPEADQPAEEVTRTRRRRAALSAPTVLFMAPEPEVPPARPQRAAVPVVEPVVAPAEAGEPEVAEPTETARRRRRGRRTEPEVPVEPEEEDIEVQEEPVDLDEEDEDEAAGRRRRRRGRRGRGRGKGPADETEDEGVEEPAHAEAEGEAEGEAEEDEGEGEEDEGGEGLTRRRRRRRRKGAGDVESAADDGVPTVVKIREPRRTDEVQGVSGSTRLEAKRQRRRDGREQRRTRPPILSESEFLARREAVDRVMVVRQRNDRTQIAVLEDGVLVEHYVSRASAGAMAGNVYLGKVQNVLPSMEAAFVDVGRGRNAVLYAGEVNWDTTGLEGRARSIEHALRSGDSVLVQVTKDPIGHKGARLTSHIALSGRHLVYVPHGNASGISRKLPDTERKRLRDILKKLVPEGAGVIVRTAAEGASEDELARDVKRLQAQWEDIQAKATEGGAPVLLYEEPDLLIRVVRDLFNEDFRELVVQGDGAYDMVESYLTHVSPDLVARLHRHVGTADVFAERRIDEQILKGLDRKVFLPSGGHLVIDRTEAMTVVDVNTGKYTGAGGNLEETVTRNNLEAAEEIVRQLRLRDLGGIVVIDFIDMVLESNRELVLRRLTECLGRDRTKHQVTEITSLGLVQMTRKRIGAGLLEAFSETCECCKGRGLIIHTEPVPEKARAAGAGEKVKAVASASSSAAATPAVAETTTGSSRRRGRKSATTERTIAEPERTVVESERTTVQPQRTVAEVSDYEDTMGYDLSRYETPAAESDDAAPAGPGAASSTGTDDASSAVESGNASAAPAPAARLAGADDPDALDENGDPDDTEPGGGRRRARRSGARRRTRP